MPEGGWWLGGSHVVKLQVTCRGPFVSVKGIKYFCGLGTLGFDLLKFILKPRQHTRLKATGASMLNFPLKHQVLTG